MKHGIYPSDIRFGLYDLFNNNEAFVRNQHPDRIEVCGVLVSRVGADAAQPVHHCTAAWVYNSHEDPVHNYRMTWADIDVTMRNHVGHGYYLRGFIHTHPKGSPDHPSYADIKAARDGYLNAVYHLGTGHITTYDNQGVTAVYKYATGVGGKTTTKKVS